MNSRIFLAGHQGMVGSALRSLLIDEGFSRIITRTRDQLDLTDQSAVRHFLESEQPQYIVIAAARVGGIHANNTYPADFIYQNLMIECNLIEGAFSTGCTALLFLGSSCIYPRDVPQPMAEEALLTGLLEPTNEAYALAKIAGIKLCEAYNRQHGTDYRSVMPTNLYGPNDNFDPLNSHVIPSLIRRIHEAKCTNASDVTVWGTGNARREFLHVNDLAKACLHVMRLSKAEYDAQTHPQLSHINVGSGTDVTIRELAKHIARTLKFRGQLIFDDSRPDGPARKLLDIGRLKATGWKPTIGLEEGLKDACRYFSEQYG